LSLNSLTAQVLSLYLEQASKNSYLELIVFAQATCVTNSTLCLKKLSQV